MDLWIACELVQASVTMVHILRAAGLLTASFTQQDGAENYALQRKIKPVKFVSTRYS